MTRTLASGEPCEAEIGLRRRDGEQIWIREACRPMRAPSGEITGAVSSFVDVTSWHVVARRLADVVAGANVGTWELDRLTGRATRSDRWFQIIGVDPDTVPPSFEALRAFVLPVDLPLLDDIPKHWESGEPYRVELRVRRADGSTKWVQVRGQAQTRPDGRPGLVAGVLVDIDARKQMETALQVALDDNIRMVAELKAALDLIQQLEGLLPICSHCKSIRDGERWVRLEAYIAQRSKATFTHGICSACLESHYPEGG